MTETGLCCSYDCSCKKKSNRRVWLLVAIVFMVGAGLAIGGGVAGAASGCFDKFQKCKNYQLSTSVCKDEADKQCHFTMYVALIAAGGGMCVILVPLICLYFCCCTSTLPYEQSDIPMHAMGSPRTPYTASSFYTPGYHPKSPASSAADMPLGASAITQRWADLHAVISPSRSDAKSEASSAARKPTLPPSYPASECAPSDAYAASRDTYPTEEGHAYVPVHQARAGGSAAGSVGASPAPTRAYNQSYAESPDVSYALSSTERSYVSSGPPAPVAMPPMERYASGRVSTSAAARMPWPGEAAAPCEYPPEDPQLRGVAVRDTTPQRGDQPPAMGAAGRQQSRLYSQAAPPPVYQASRLGPARLGGPTPPPEDAYDNDAPPPSAAPRPMSRYADSEHYMAPVPPPAASRQHGYEHDSNDGSVPADARGPSPLRYGERDSGYVAGLTARGPSPLRYEREGSRYMRGLAASRMSRHDAASNSYTTPAAAAAWGMRDEYDGPAADPSPPPPQQLPVRYERDSSYVLATAATRLSRFERDEQGYGAPAGSRLQQQQQQPVRYEEQRSFAPRPVRNDYTAPVPAAAPGDSYAPTYTAAEERGEGSEGEDLFPRVRGILGAAGAGAAPATQRRSAEPLRDASRSYAAVGAVSRQSLLVQAAGENSSAPEGGSRTRTERTHSPSGRRLRTFRDA